MRTSGLWRRRKAIRRNARLAYGRELDAYREELVLRFGALGRGEIRSQDLVKDIEHFHDEIMSEQQEFLEEPNPENVFGWAVANHVISKNELVEDIAHTIGRAVKAMATGLAMP